MTKPQERQKTRGWNAGGRRLRVKVLSSAVVTRQSGKKKIQLSTTKVKKLDGGSGEGKEDRDELTTVGDGRITGLRKYKRRWG